MTFLVCNNTHFFKLVNFCYGELKKAPILTIVSFYNPKFILFLFFRLLIVSLEECWTLQYSPGILFILLEDIVVIALTQHYIFKMGFVFLNHVIFVHEMVEVVFLTNCSKLIILNFLDFLGTERNSKKFLQLWFFVFLYAAGKLVDIILLFFHKFRSIFFERVVNDFQLVGKLFARGSVNVICGKDRCGILKGSLDHRFLVKGTSLLNI